MSYYTESKEDIGISYGIITDSFIETKSEEKSELGLSENPKITVTSPMKVDPGFFSKSYISYLITTTPLNLQVRRRFTDFEWLRTILVKYYYMNIIPTLTNKNKFFRDTFAESFTIKRSRKLEKFMNYLLMDPIIKNSNLLYDFISIEKDEDFNEKKKIYDKLEQPKEITENQSMSGKANVEVNYEKEIFYDNVKDKLSSKSNLFYQLNQNIKILKTKIEDICLHIDLLSKNFDDLSKANTEDFDGKQVIQAYAYFSDTFKNWSKALKNHNDIIFTDIREYFKYVKNNYETMNDMIYRVNTNRDIFRKAEQKLINEKEALAKKGYINKTDILIEDQQIDKEKKEKIDKERNTVLMKIMPKETSEVVKLKTNYGYFLNKFIEEFERLKSVNASLHSKTFAETGKKIIGIYIEFEKVYLNIINLISKKA